MLGYAIYNKLRTTVITFRVLVKVYSLQSTVGLIDNAVKPISGGRARVCNAIFPILLHSLPRLIELRDEGIQRPIWIHLNEIPTILVHDRPLDIHYLTLLEITVRFNLRAIIKSNPSIVLLHQPIFN